jgi:hypothetical protein
MYGNTSAYGQQPGYGGALNAPVGQAQQPAYGHAQQSFSAQPAQGFGQPPQVAPGTYGAAPQQAALGTYGGPAAQYGQPQQQPVGGAYGQQPQFGNNAGSSAAYGGNQVCVSAICMLLVSWLACALSRRRYVRIMTGKEISTNIETRSCTVSLMATLCQCVKTGTYQNIASCSCQTSQVNGLVNVLFWLTLL